MIKKISFILLLFFVLGCQDKKETIFNPKPCMVKYPIEDVDSWKIICSGAPYTNGMIIEEHLFKPLEKVGILCPGYPLPSAEDVNCVCENEYNSLLDN